MKILYPVVISLTFLAGFSLLDYFVLAKIARKKIYCFFIALVYSVFFWSFVYMLFIARP